MASISKTQNFITKNRITIIAILAFVVAICCILAFASNKSEDSVAFSEAESSVGTEVSKEVLSEGYGVYIDEHFVAAVESEELANEVLENVLDARVTSLGIASETVCGFNNDIELVNGKYSSESFVDSEKLLQLFGKKNVFGVSDKITDYNGKILPVKLAVRSEVTYTELVTLEYETKTVYTDALRDGVTKVISKGYNGEGEETYRLISIDGVVSEREVLSVNVIVEPANEVIRKGTSSNGIDVASLGTFIRPYDGVITSYVGPRWGRTHNGIDIAGDGCKGKPAVAACDGVVVRADWYGGYGNCVIIDHGDGVQTLYAHLSAFSVQVGDVLEAGDEVGKIGSTGNSTGPHLHFEVHVDGEIVNPLIFVDYED